MVLGVCVCVCVCVCDVDSTVKTVARLITKLILKIPRVMFFKLKIEIIFC